MTSTWRRLAAALAVAVAGALVVPASLAGAQATDPDPGEAGGDAPIGEGDQVGDGDIVHSWTLVPAAAEHPERAGSYRPNLSYEAAPGATIDDAVTVFNYGTVPLTFAVFGTDAFNNPDGDFDLLPTDEQPEDVGSWVTLAQRNLTVAPGKAVTVPITIAVPADARPGDHVGAVLASAPVQGTGPDGKLVEFDRRTGTRLYVRVEGPLAPELAVTGIRTVYQPALNPLDGSATVTYRIENRGNVRLGAKHRVSVSGPLGIGTRRSPADELAELLPGEDVTFTTTLDGVLAGGVALTDVTVDPIPIGDAAEVETATGRSTTIALPLTVLATVLAAALGLYARRAYRRHHVGDTDLRVAEPLP